MDFRSEDELWGDQTLATYRNRIIKTVHKNETNNYLTNIAMKPFRSVEIGIDPE